MPWRICCVFVALFVLANAQSDRAHRWGSSKEPWKVKNPSDSFIDIDLETERTSGVDQAWQDMEETSGSGSGVDVTDDEDLLASGSGSGDGIPESRGKSTTRPTVVPAATSTPTPTTRTTAKRLTPCQQLREASQHLSISYVPNCDSKGDYTILQCNGQPQKGKCWCADLQGREIPGTDLDEEIPDCVGGTNLPRCVFQLVWQMRRTVMSTFRPQCTLDGHFESIQCKGNICFCVDPTFGDMIGGTEVIVPDRPNCDGTTPGKDDKHEHRITLFPPGPRTTPSVDTDAPTKVNIRLDDDKEDSREDDDSSEEVSNETGDGGKEPMKEPSNAASMMTQPGILAAIIGGSVVLFLCAILLAMFIIYRMKKKDEGSYPLDEPKKMPNYSYQRAPEKEFYA